MKITKKILKKYKDKIREKAIEQTKVELALNNRNINDISDAELETLVQQQEKDLFAKYKDRTLYAVLAFLGLVHYEMACCPF